MGLNQQLAPKLKAERDADEAELDVPGLAATFKYSNFYTNPTASCMDLPRTSLKQLCLELGLQVYLPVVSSQALGYADLPGYSRRLA
jgi:hypothetical protein